MICAGIKSNIVVAIIDCPDVETYNQFSYHFENLIDLTDYTITPGIGWTMSENQFNYGQLNSVPSVKITKLAFESRLAIAEEGAIIGFALANIMQYYTTPTHPYFLAGCQVLAFLRRQANANYVDLYRQDTIQGVNSLVGLGLLTAPRANTVLTTPPTYVELYKGKE
jgi:hypothetical protein